jgi:hypothetical protein
VEQIYGWACDEAVVRLRQCKKLPVRKVQQIFSFDLDKTIPRKIETKNKQIKPTGPTAK